MTGPNEPIVRRVAALEEAVGRVAAQLDTLGSSFTGAGTRLTAVEATVDEAVKQFSPVGKRVEELSAAFLAANERLVNLEEAVTALQGAAPPPTAELEQALARLAERLDTVEQQRNRGGRLSSRLRSIEEKLDRVLPEEVAK